MRNRNAAAKITTLRVPVTTGGNARKPRFPHPISTVTTFTTYRILNSKRGGCRRVVKTPYGGGNVGTVVTPLLPYLRSATSDPLHDLLHAGSDIDVQEGV